MCDTFAKSTMAWKAWCGRLGAKYILWDADMVDALMSKHADRESMWLYENARYGVQQCDVARFLILYVYGGMYADLDTFPNRPTYPQVSLGLPKIPSRAPMQDPEWEMEVIVATRGNANLLKIMANQVQSYRARLSEEHKQFYEDKPCRFIYQTTGPKALSRYIKQSGLETWVHLFVMNRPSKSFPAHNLYWDHAYSQPAQSLLMQYACGYDILSCFSMSYRGCPMRSAEFVDRLPANSIHVELPETPPLVSRRLLGKQPSHTEPPSSMQQRVLPVDSDDTQLQVVAVASMAEASHATQRSGSIVTNSSKCCQPIVGDGDTRDDARDDIQQGSSHAERTALADFLDLFRTEGDRSYVNLTYDQLEYDTQKLIREPNIRPAAT